MVAYPLACALPKLAICAFYIQVFNISPPVRRITYAMIVFIVANAIAWEVLSTFICRPASARWTMAYGPTTHCVKLNTYFTWISLPHIISDLVLVAIPLPKLWNTHMKTAKKVGVMITFLTASV